MSCSVVDDATRAALSKWLFISFPPAHFNLINTATIGSYSELSLTVNIKQHTTSVHSQCKTTPHTKIVA